MIDERTPKQIEAAIARLRETAFSHGWMWESGWRFRSPRSGIVFDLSATDPELFDWASK